MEESSEYIEGSEKIPTRQKILECAVELFAEKGYTETSIRELASAVGLKEASLYNHFSSKNAILEFILEEYTEFTRAAFERDKVATIKDNPTADGILSCMQLVFPKEKAGYYLKELCVILQEQHRNPAVRKFITDHFIHRNEQVIRDLIQALKDFNIIRQDTDPDFWIKLHSSLLYSFSSRLMLGIGDSSPGFSGLGLSGMLWNVYDLLLKNHRI